MSYSAAGLQTPILETVEIRKHFIEKAGAFYGAIVAIGFMLFFWLPDAITLRQVSYQLWWGKLVLGLFASLCICVPIGWLAARSRWSGISLLLWIVAGGLLAWIGGRVQFDGLSWLARLTDPYPSGQSMYPFTPSAAAFTGFGIVVGAGAGLIIGLLSFLALDRAWNHATDRNRFSVRSIAMLCVCLPVLLGFGLLADFQINSTPRTALTDVQREIEITRDPSVDLARARVISMRPFRGQLTPHYTLFWNKVSPDLVSTTIDTQFDNGLLLRCTQTFGNVLPCADLGKNLHDWMMQLVTVGHLTCMGCSVQVERSTLHWLNTTLPAIGNLQDVMLLQHQGGWIYMRAMFDSGRKIDCRFRGDQPIIVDLCVEVK